MKLQKLFRTMTAAGTAIAMLCTSFLGVTAFAEELTDGNYYLTEDPHSAEMPPSWGQIRVIVPGAGTSQDTISVLYDDGNVWVRPAEFSQIFTDTFSKKNTEDGTYEDTRAYTYTYDEDEHAGVIQVYDREIAIRKDEMACGYRIGEQECFYLLSSDVIYWYGDLWMPAADFFYLVGSPVTVISDDSLGDAEYLKIEQPRYSLIDILTEMEARTAGADYNFSYTSDLQVSEEDLNDLFQAANIASALYGAATYDWGTLAEILDSDAATIGSLFGLEDDDASLADEVEMKAFLQEMLAMSDSDMTALLSEASKDSEAALALLEWAGKEAGEAAEACPELDQSLTQLYYQIAEIKDGGLMPDDLINQFDELVESNADMKALDEFSDSAGTISGYASAAGKILGVYLSYQSACDQAESQDAVMLKAVEKYARAAEEKTLLPADIYQAFQEEWPIVSQDFALKNVSVMNSICEIALDAAAEALLKGISTEAVETGLAGLAGAGGLTIADACVSIIAPIEEDFLNMTFGLAKIDQAESMILSIYGRVYSVDAWNAYQTAYRPIAENGFVTVSGETNERFGTDDLETAAYLAANYLKACQVTVSSARNALNSEKFAGTSAESVLIDRQSLIAQELNPLYEDLAILNDGSSSQAECDAARGILVSDTVHFILNDSHAKMADYESFLHMTAISNPDLTVTGDPLNSPVIFDRDLIEPLPVIKWSRSYDGGEHYVITAFDAETETTLWTYATSYDTTGLQTSHIEPLGTFAGEYFLYDFNTIYALNAYTGEFDFGISDDKTASLASATCLTGDYENGIAYVGFLFVGETVIGINMALWENHMGEVALEKDFSEDPFPDGYYPGGDYAGELFIQGDYMILEKVNYDDTIIYGFYNMKTGEKSLTCPEGVDMSQYPTRHQW